MQKQIHGILILDFSNLLPVDWTEALGNLNMELICSAFKTCKAFKEKQGITGVVSNGAELF